VKIQILLVVILGWALCSCSERPAETPSFPPSYPSLGDFDSDAVGDILPNGWLVLQENNASALFTIVPHQAEIEGNALEVTVHEAGLQSEDIQLVKQDIPVTLGEPHTVSFWVKSNDGARGSVGIAQPGGGVVTSFPFVTSNQWKKLSFEFTPNTALIHLPLFFSMPENAGRSLLIDQINVERVILEEDRKALLVFDEQAGKSATEQARGKTWVSPNPPREA
jgi:hypothetical protein